jgi:hypothetical protein
LYFDVDEVVHGFVRDPTGAITTFEAPGAGTEPASSQGTRAFSISQRGEIAGYYTDAVGMNHGFVRAADGTITTIDAPGANTFASEGTKAWSINAAGTVTGYYQDVHQAAHGFVCATNGVISEFHAPGASTAEGEGTIASFSAAGPNTYPNSINTDGVIVGRTGSQGGTSRGFVRGLHTTTFRVPGAGVAYEWGTFPMSIGDSGAVAGSYTGANCVSHGILLTP